MDANEVSVVRDELATTREHLQRAEERLTAGQLALEVMHEIRNPLEAISYLIYLAKADADDPAKVRNHMSRAEEQISTLNHIASQTLGFARTSKSPESSDLAGVAEAALRIHQRAIQAKGVNLVKEFPENLVAEVFTVEILQVLSNVIVNALDALPTNGTLRLRLRKSQDKIYLLIADNGHGIASENTDKIFQPFFTTKESRGTGLGLALSKNIIERHKGKICVRSTNRPGRSGTIFKISIPA